MGRAFNVIVDLVMTRFETPSIAIVGTGEIGRGWAALAVAAGWPVTIYDSDAEALSPAADIIGDRVVGLVRLKRAEATVADSISPTQGPNQNIRHLSRFLVIFIMLL